MTLDTAIAPPPHKQRKPKHKSKCKRKLSRAEARRRGRERRLAERRQLLLKLKNIGGLPDDACMTFGEWCALNMFSERQGRRILAGPDGPVVTALSERRIGITVGNNRRWQESRARGGA
jgi:hypothetical protein